MREKISFEEPLTVKGYWYIPNAPDNYVAGILYYLPHDKIKLELLGSFHNNESSFAALLKSVDLDIIYGVTSDGINVSLFKCFQSGTANLSSPFALINYTVSFIIWGAHINNLDNKCISSAFVDFDGLSYWCLPSLIKENIYTPEIKIKLKDNNVIVSIPLDDNTTLSLSENIESHAEQYSMTVQIEQSTNLNITCTKTICFKELYKIIHQFEQFLTLATMYYIKCNKIKLNVNADYNGDVFVLYTQHDFIKNIIIDRNHFLFSYEDIKNEFPHIIKKWFSDVTIAPIRSHLIESIFPKIIFKNIDFQIVIYALEGYHKRFHSDKRLKDILEFFVERYKNICTITLTSDIIEKIRLSRNYFSHLYIDNTNVLLGKDLHFITLQLKRLLVCCVLEFVGFTLDKMKLILKQTNNSLFT